MMIVQPLQKSLRDLADGACDLADNLLDMAPEGHSITPGEIDFTASYVASIAADRIRASAAFAGSTHVSVALVVKPIEIEVASKVRAYLFSKFPPVVSPQN